MIVRVRPNTVEKETPSAARSPERCKDRGSRGRPALKGATKGFIGGEWAEPGDVLDMSWMQQPVDHVEDKQRLHPIIGETFPGFGESDVAESARMTDEAAILWVVHGRRVLRPTLFLASAGEFQKS